MKIQLILVPALLLSACGHGTTEEPSLGDVGRGLVALAAAPKVSAPPNWRTLCREVQPITPPPIGGDTNGWREVETAGDYQFIRSGQILTDAQGRLVERRLTQIEAFYVGPKQHALGGPWRCRG